MNITFRDAHGQHLNPWMIRAGMRIMATSYDHRSRSVTYVVG